MNEKTSRLINGESWMDSSQLGARGLCQGGPPLIGDCDHSNTLGFPVGRNIESGYAKVSTHRSAVWEPGPMSYCMHGSISKTANFIPGFRLFPLVSTGFRVSRNLEPGNLETYKTPVKMSSEMLTTT